ncbi:hypothetical protein ACFWG0_37765, partial [Streptomyces yangpuensis]|uniref:hypothetical protein n=1 Tax=Streptomyces yangpuensis TaxID=1648182 RepID=UPI00364DB1F2
GVLGVFGVFGVLPTPPGVFGVLGVFGVFGVLRVTTLLHPAFLCLQGVFVVESTALTAVWGAGAARAVAGRAIPPARATEAATRIVLREILNIAFLHSEMRDFCEIHPAESDIFPTPAAAEGLIPRNPIPEVDTRHIIT